MKLVRFFQRPEYPSGYPKPAKAFIPDWYKKAESQYTTKDGETFNGLKTCVPYLDGLTAGYMLVTPVNIYVNEKNDDLSNLQIRWDGPASLKSFIKERDPESGATMPRPAGHYPNHLIWEGFWTIKTPKNYSLLFTHPFNRYDLPFTTVSGLVDSDKFFAAGNVPFFIKEGFSGVIPANTPIVQLVPIKRDTWNSVTNDKSLADKDLMHSSWVANKETNYKKKFWQRKSYS